MITNGGLPVVVYADRNAVQQRDKLLELDTVGISENRGESGRPRVPGARATVDGGDHGTENAMTFAARARSATVSRVG